LARCDHLLDESVLLRREADVPGWHLIVSIAGLANFANAGSAREPAASALADGAQHRRPIDQASIPHHPREWRQDIVAALRPSATQQSLILPLPIGRTATPRATGGLQPERCNALTNSAPSWASARRRRFSNMRSGVIRLRVHVGPGYGCRRRS